jgi:voltage-gated potassium channel
VDNLSTLRVVDDEVFLGWLASVQRTIFRLLDAEARDTRLERAGNLFLATLIVSNVAAVIVESIASARARYGAVFDAFEVISVAAFTVEYALRLWSCTVDPRFAGPVTGRIRYAIRPMSIVDLLAIVPAYLPGDPFLDLRFIRALRLVRMMRALKMARYSRSLQTFGNVLKAHTTDLSLVVVLLLVMLVVSASLMYFAENAAQPKVFSSIPGAMWWAVVTLTTVGYGDVFPITPWGKVLGAFIALLGIGFFALPAGILASGFTEELARRRGARMCPHCGREL